MMANLQHPLFLQRQPSTRESSLESLSNAHRDFRTSVLLANLSRGNNNETFPEILHAMIEDPCQEAIKWKVHGLSFIVQDREDLIQRILPKYFGQATKYTSFTRKLQRWNFRRIPVGPNAGSWFNEKFARDTSKTALKEMKCVPRNTKKVLKNNKNTKSSKNGVTKMSTSPVGAQQSSLIRPSPSKPTNGSRKQVVHKIPLKKRVVDPCQFLLEPIRETIEQEHMLLLVERYCALRRMAVLSKY